MSPYISHLIEVHPGDTLARVKALLALHGSVDWETPLEGARYGEMVLFDEIRAALEYVIDQICEVHLDHFKAVEMGNEATALFMAAALKAQEAESKV